MPENQGIERSYRNRKRKINMHKESKPLMPKNTKVTKHVIIHNAWCYALVYINEMTLEREILKTNYRCT